MKTRRVNTVEEAVLRVCQRSFLSLWCYDNLGGMDNDDLRDTLVVCK
jgi:hypothetical protein